jgi:UDP-glucose 4-epimerase
MEIAVIGGSGFIGSHIVDKLIASGHSVTVFDIMRPHRHDVRHILLDVLDPLRVNIALADEYDAVYMLAAMANVNHVYRNPVEAGHLNIMAVANVLEAARRHGIRRVILASTVWVYEMACGAQGSEALGEEEPLLPSLVNHVYTATKLAMELYSTAYSKLYGVEVTILRYGIPYGPRARRGTVIANFVHHAVTGRPLVIYGDGNQARNFIYVEDLAEGNVAALRPEAANKTFNLDGPRAVTVREIAEIITELIPGTRIEYRPARPGDFEGRSASVLKAQSELGWVPRIDIREGIRRYIEWYRCTKL